MVYGIGINDADYVTQRTVNGKRVICPFYSTWQNMLMRCYSKKYQEKDQRTLTALFAMSGLYLVILRHGWKRWIGKISS